MQPEKANEIDGELSSFRATNIPQSVLHSTRRAQEAVLRGCAVLQFCLQFHWMLISGRLEASSCVAPQEVLRLLQHETRCSVPIETLFHDFGSTQLDST